MTYPAWAFENGLPDDASIDDDEDGPYWDCDRGWDGWEGGCEEDD